MSFDAVAAAIRGVQRTADRDLEVPVYFCQERADARATATAPTLGGVVSAGWRSDTGFPADVFFGATFRLLKIQRPADDVVPDGGTMPSSDAVWLRHTVATLAYRAEKVLRDVPPGFGDFRASPHSRSALALVAHLGDLMEWGIRMTRGDKQWQPVPQPSWEAACERFFQAIATLDHALAESGPRPLGHEVLFQGPVADALTHVGQLALMRGMVGEPVRPESYARATIAVGRVGRDQPVERVEFDADASPQSTTGQ